LRDECRLKVFENRVLSRIFVPRRDEVRWECRKLHNEELNDLHSSHNIVRVIKSRGIRWVGHIASLREKRGVYRVMLGEPEERNRLGDPGVEGRIILKWIFRKWDVGGLDWIDLDVDRDRWRALVNAVMNLRFP
jgi:hypothetical protein